MMKQAAVNPSWKKEAIFFQHSRIILLVSTLIVIMSYFFADIPLANYFEHLSFPWKTRTTFITNLIHPKYHNYVWPILFFSIRYLFGMKLWGNRLLLLVVSVPTTNFLVWVIKWISGRARPELLFSQHLYAFTFFKWDQPFESFPSGHACTIGAICGAFACFYPRLSLLIAILGFILAFSRVVLTLHFLSDVIAGFTLGLLVSQWIYAVMKKRGVQF